MLVPKTKPETIKKALVKSPILDAGLKNRTITPVTNKTEATIRMTHLIQSWLELWDFFMRCHQLLMA